MGYYLPHLESARKGDKLAFGELVQAFEGFAFSEAARQLSDKSLIEDAVQESFIIAYLHLPDLKDPLAFPAWLKKIIRTCCRKLRSQNAPILLDPDALHDLADPGPTPFEAMVRRQERALVGNILKLLKEDVREAFLQRYVHGRSYNEIADMLGLPVGTVKRRLHDSRAKFIHHLKQQTESVIRVGYLPISDHLLAMVSHQMHDRQNYTILLRRYLSWSSLVNSLRAEMLDAAFIMAPLALSLRAEGMPILYVLDAHQNGSAITVRRDASYKPAEIHGRLGLPHEISTHGVILHYMFGNQPNEAYGSIKRKYISPSYLSKSLETRNIDAFFCAEPWNTKAVLDGTGRILAHSSEIYPGHICCVLVVSESFAARQGDTLKQYLDLLLRANEAVAARPDYCARIQAKYTGVSADVVETVLSKKTTTYHDLFPDKDRIESVMNLALRAGILKKPCDIDAFIRKDFV